MARTARIATSVEAAAQPTVVVPVVFDDGRFIAESVPATLGGRASRGRSPRVVHQQGLKPDAGSVTVLRTLRHERRLRSLGSTITRSRLPTAGAPRRVRQRRSVGFFLPTDGIDDPSTRPSSRHGALLASYKYNRRRDHDLRRRTARLTVATSRPMTTSRKARAREPSRRGNWANSRRLTAGSMPPKNWPDSPVTLDDDEHVSVEI